jgi:hypothetical protein
MSDRLAVNSSNVPANAGDLVENPSSASVSGQFTNMLDLTRCFGAEGAALVGRPRSLVEPFSAA